MNEMDSTSIALHEKNGTSAKTFTKDCDSKAYFNRGKPLQSLYSIAKKKIHLLKPFIFFFVSKLIKSIQYFVIIVFIFSSNN